MIGCSYPGTSAALKGCVNDVQCMEYGLKKHFGFTDSEIVILRDDGRERGPDFRSTRANIFKGIQWLMTDLVPNQPVSLIFHFSGHGSQKRAADCSEADGFDETICPSDYERAGQIVDNELNHALIAPLPPGVTLHCVVDACHSGTTMDLPFSTEFDHNRRQYVWTGHPHNQKRTRGGLAIQIGACKDSQVAQDTTALSGGTFTGAATYSFLQAIEAQGPRQSYGALLNHMTTTLRKHTSGASASGGGGMGGMFGMLLGGGSFSSGNGGRDEQIPVLSCDRPLDFLTPLAI